MKQAFWFLYALILSLFICGSLHSIEAQTSSPTPDPFVVQLTSSPSGAFSTFMGDMTANGRFVVFTSNADIATQRTDERNNKDGNREIFLADYAQRRIFQITNTRNVANPAASPSPTPTPSPSPSPTASPTPTPTPTPADSSQVKIQIDNLSPMISLTGTVVAGQRIYTIVFSSNAPDPKIFDGTEGSLATDGNTEIWIYRFSAGPDVDLTLGADLPVIPIDQGTFNRITDTTPSRVPRPGSSTAAPFYADDNREATISDDGNLIAFISTRNLDPGVGNADGNPELFFYNISSTTFRQATNTQDAVVGVGLVFQSNPSISSNGSVVAFLSSANLAGSNNDANGAGNAEVYVADFSGAALTNIRQVTRTKTNATTPVNVNIWSPGRRLSRDGGYLAFESLANDPKANSDSNNAYLGLFVYTVATDTFTLIGTRPTTGFPDIGRFPTFTDYQAGTLIPSSLVFVSALNFRPDGTIPATADVAQGLNPLFAPQIFLTQLPASTSNTFVRLTNVGTSLLAAVRPATSDSRTRMAFALPYDFGGGNTDVSGEIFYLLSPIITAQSGAALSFFTGASNMPVATATPVPSPTPTPTPTPSPSPDVALGLAPGELSIVRSTVALAPGDAAATGGSETKRSPALPVELNGVSVSVNGAAAGLYFVGSDSKQINFVVPISLRLGLGTVAVNINDTGANTDTLLRGFVQIVPGQPDIFTSTNDAGGRAFVFNVTDPNARSGEPFNVTSPDASGNTVPTILELDLTGIRLAAKADVTVTVGTTVISGDSIVLVKSNPEMPGFDIINFTLPASLAGAGDVPILVTFTRAGQPTTTSRSTATAAHITIN